MDIVPVEIGANYIYTYYNSGINIKFIHTSNKLMGIFIERPYKSVALRKTIVKINNIILRTNNTRLQLPTVPYANWNLRTGVTKNMMQNSNYQLFRSTYL